MDFMTALASIAATVLTMVQTHITDPKNRLEVIQTFQADMMKLAKEVTDGSNTPEKVDELESLFLNAVRAL